MHLTQYLIFEICRECNLGAFHKECPNRHPERYGTMPADEPLNDEQIVSIAKAMYLTHGFRGRVGWHFFCEPLVAAERMWRLMERMEREIEGVSFTLWTNGTLLPEDCSEFRRFDEIHVTDYRLPSHPVRNLAAVKKAQPATKVHRWRLDDRLHGIGDEVSYAPCHRMFTEMIFDFYGNVHLCCFDWQGRASVGNAHRDSVPELIRRWHKVRNQISGEAMDPDAPAACLGCKMRSAGITRFVPEVAMDAERWVREARE